MAYEDFYAEVSAFLKKSSRSLMDKVKLDITDLIKAVRDNDPDEVARALNAWVDPNEEDGIARTPLPYAVENNDKMIVGMLLQKKANPNIIAKDGQTPLYKAVFWENTEIVALLLDAGADANLPNRNGKTPMQLAIESGYDEIAEMLKGKASAKKAKAKPVKTKAKKGSSPEAIKERAIKLGRQKEKDEATHKKLRRLSAEAKAKRIIEENKKKMAAEEKAKKSAATKAAKIEKKYEKFGKDTQSALIQAIIDKDSSAVRHFAQNTKDINKVSKQFKTTPLMMSIDQQNEKLAQYLLDQDADATTILDEYSPLTKAVRMEMHKLVKNMLKADKEAVAAVLNNPQQLLSPQFLAYKDAKMLNILLEAGADPHFGGKDGVSPIANAIEKASIAILPVLSRNKVDLDKETDGKRPIEWAIEHKRVDWVNGLIGEKVDLTLPMSNGKTALELAKKKRGRKEIVAMLEAEM